MVVATATNGSEPTSTYRLVNMEANFRPGTIVSYFQGRRPRKAEVVEVQEDGRLLIAQKSGGFISKHVIDAEDATPISSLKGKKVKIRYRG